MKTNCNMKLPKTVNICGHEYKVLQDPKDGGGAFSEAKRTITIGTYYPDEMQEILLHEVIEAVIAIRNHRYTLNTNAPLQGDYKFVFDHYQYEQWIKDVAFALKGIQL